MNRKTIRIISFILLVSYVWIVLDKALIGRDYTVDSLCKLYTDWDLVLVKNKTPYPLLNLLLFAPVSFLLRISFPKIDRLYGIIIALILAFAGSSFIEGMQLLFRIGYFQISDLVYNTISVLWGIFAYRILFCFVKRDGDTQ